MVPKVAIVGRPNVGKSSLLNRLAGRLISIVEPTAGVTRDRVTYDLELPKLKRDDDPRYCQMIDTGGYGVYSGDDTYSAFTEAIEAQIDAAVDQADLILFVFDVQEGVVPLDEQVADLLRRRADLSKVVLVANKVDHRKFEADAFEALRLGVGEPMMFSATTGYGRPELIDLIDERVGAWAGSEPDQSEMLVAIVGKRNAGKSTLVNTLAGSTRVIASEIAGTTRDSIDVRFEMDDKVMTAIDTAGVRKKKSLADDVEYYSMHRSLRAIRRADVVLLMIDATEPISQVDKKLGREIQDHHKPCVIVINKWDLAEDQVETEKFIDYISKVMTGLSYAPIVFISAAKNELVRQTIRTAFDLFRQANERVSTGKLNQVVRDILIKRGPSPRLGKQAKIYYVTMPTVDPPTIVLFVNRAELFEEHYRRYLVNQFRELLPYAEVPIRLLIRSRRRPTDGELLVEA